MYTVFSGTEETEDLLNERLQKVKNTLINSDLNTLFQSLQPTHHNYRQKQGLTFSC